MLINTTSYQLPLRLNYKLKDHKALQKQVS